MAGRGNGGFAAAVLVLTGILFFCCAGTVMSRASLGVQEVEGYYREKEKGLVEAARDFLDGEGFVHSGVTLTRVVDASGVREYTLTVHHGRIDRMDEAGRQRLMADLEKIVFEDGACTFRHEFFINP